MSVFDFKPGLHWSLSNLPVLGKGSAHEPGTECFRPSTRLSAQARVQSMRSPVSRQPACSVLLLLSSVSVHDLRPTYLPRQPARYRNLFASPQEQTVSLRLSW